MWKRSLAATVILLALLAVALLAKRRLPPYESGTHSIEVHAGKSPHFGICPIFPPDNIWNTPIDTLPTLPKTRAYVDPTQRLHADFGSNLTYGIPFTEVLENTKFVPVTFEYRDASDPGPYPIPPDAPIEHGSDHHVLLVDPHHCVLYELYRAEPQPDGSWTAVSGIRMGLNANDLRPDGLTSADAAGLPIFPGLVRYDEVASGEIRHALRFTLPQTRNAYVWPARHQASPSSDPNFLPLGTRFRLRAGFDIARYPPSAQVILRALKRYGMFLADNGSPMYLSGVSDKRWNDNDLRVLGAITANDFEAVDESSLQLAPNSAQAAPPRR